MSTVTLGALVWYMCDGRVHSAPVLSIQTVQNLHEEWAHTNEQKHTFTRFGTARTDVATVHGTFDAKACYSSKKELLESL
jgi:hypothetical protein